MARRKKDYIRLPGRPFTGFGTKMLWQGPDHLLWVERYMGQETYRRFYYKDIQALVMRRTRRHYLWNAVWGAFALLFGLMVVNASGPAYAALFLTGIFTALLLGSLFLGPSCEVHVQTAVQIHRLTSLRRVRSGRKVMSRVKPLIEAVQGPLDPTDLPGGSPAAAGAALRSGAESIGLPQGARDTNEAHQRPFKPHLHRLLFGLMATTGLVRLLQFRVAHLALTMLDFFLLSVVLAVAIAALAQWHAQIKGTRLAALNWISLAVVVLYGLAAYVVFIVLTFRNPEMAHNHWAMMRLMAEFHTSGQGVVLVANLIAAAASLLLGALGLMTLRGSRQKPHPADPS
jgi:hypothetical protein